MRVGQSGQCKIMIDMAVFGFFAAEEFAARGHIEEQAADFNARAGGTAGGFDIDQLPAVYDDLRGGGVTVAFAACERHAADTGDARERFATKPHGMDGMQIFGLLDFAGGVTFEAEEGVVFAHADAVIGDTNEAPAAGLDFNCDGSRLRINRVFDELLYDAGGALDHFARGDLVRHVLGQQADAIHTRVRPRSEPSPRPSPFRKGRGRSVVRFSRCPSRLE